LNAEGINMIVTFTLDVERDWYKGEFYKKNPTFDFLNLSLKRFFKVGDEYSIFYTLFVTREVVIYARELIEGLKHEIGLHIHPFTHMVPPLPSPENDSLANYSKMKQKGMIEADKKLIEDLLSVKLESFRAGNLSINVATFKILAELGFKYDSSIFRGASLIGWKPYKIGNIIEIPIFYYIGSESNYSYLKARLSMMNLLVKCDTVVNLLLHPQQFGAPIYEFETIMKEFENFIDFMTTKIHPKFLTIKETGSFVNKNDRYNNLANILSISPFQFRKFINGFKRVDYIDSLML